jgi:3-oxoacyl-[acyl-carrier-protein] synthase II
MGVISSAGIGKEDFRNVLQHGISRMGNIHTFRTDDLPTKIGASVRDFDSKDFLERKFAKRLDRAGHFFAVLCKMALEDANLKQINPFRTGICEATSLGGIPHALDEQEKYLTSHAQRVNPLIAIRAMTGAAGSIASIINNIKGPVSAVSNGSVSSASALFNAYNHLRQNQADVILAGGAEAPLVRQMFLIFCAAGMLSKNWNASPEKACRPFDSKRDGMILGEGGAVLVLEK